MLSKAMQLATGGLSHYMGKLLELCNYHSDFFHCLSIVARLEGKAGGHWEKTGIFLQSYYLQFPS